MNKDFDLLLKVITRSRNLFYMDNYSNHKVLRIHLHAMQTIWLMNKKNGALHNITCIPCLTIIYLIQVNINRSFPRTIVTWNYNVYCSRKFDIKLKEVIKLSNGYKILKISNKKYR